MLTAAAASLGLMPIAPEIFWGPMAYAMMGGIIVGTLLTLLFLPALYVTWFRIKEPAAGSKSSDLASAFASEERPPEETRPRATSAPIKVMDPV
jgi:multidrug efflux pump